MLLVQAVVLSLPAAASAAEPGQPGPRVVHVGKTFDGRPFDYCIVSQAEKDGYMVYSLSYPSPVVTAVPQNNTVPAEFYLPAGIRPGGPRRPAVISIHILDGNMELVRMTCAVLASRGIPAILFKLPYYGERGLPEGPHAMARNPHLFTSAVSQAFQDVRRTVDLLASRPEIDPERIGITGTSLGAIVAASAAESEPRLSRAMLVLGGGDLLKTIHHARETGELSRLIESLPTAERAEVEKAIESVDPVQHADRLRDRAQRGKVLMVNAAQDEVIPRECTEKLASALGIADRVVWLQGLGHYTALASLPQILQQMVVFFGEDLPPGAMTTPPTPRRTPVQMVLALAQEAIGFFTNAPAEGRCHFADLELSATLKDGKPIHGRVRLICGAQGKFKLECQIPQIGDVSIGQGLYPWMAATTKAVFKGTKNGGKPGDPLAFADSRYLTRLKVAAGAVGGAAFAPDILDPLAAITEDPPVGGHPAVRINPKGKAKGTVRVLFQEDKKTPHEVLFEVNGVRGAVKFHAWAANTAAHAGMFDPPGGREEKEVEPIELYRIFSAMFNFAMEMAQ